MKYILSVIAGIIIGNMVTFVYFPRIEKEFVIKTVEKECEECKECPKPTRIVVNKCRYSHVTRNVVGTVSSIKEAIRYYNTRHTPKISSIFIYNNRINFHYSD